MKLEGSVAVVLGGARGIGRAYCESLLERKAKVVCTDILDDVGKQAEAELQQKYGTDHVVYRSCNGANDEQVRATLNFAKTHFGKLDIVVNNVGIVDETNWQRTIDINLGTTVRVTNAALELLGKDKGGNGGVVVHTASNGVAGMKSLASIYNDIATFNMHTKPTDFNLNIRFGPCVLLSSLLRYKSGNDCVRQVVDSTAFLAENNDPTKVIKLDVLMKLMDIEDKSKILRPEWVGEAMAKALEDDTANGVAVQLLGREPRYQFQGPNDEVLSAAPLK